MIAGFDQASSGRILLERARRRRAAAVQAPGQHGLPELRPVPAHDRGAERRLRPGDAGQAQGRGRARASARCCAWCGWRTSPAAPPASSRAGSSSAWRWPGPWRRIPEVLLLDEPLSALDLKLRKAMQIELKRLQRDTGITFVFVTHDQEEALTMSDRIAVMSQGTVRQVGSPREIYDHPAERFVADFIGEANMLKGELVRCEQRSRPGPAGGRGRGVGAGSRGRAAARRGDGGRPAGARRLARRGGRPRAGGRGRKCGLRRDATPNTICASPAASRSSSAARTPAPTWHQSRSAPGSRCCSASTPSRCCAIDAPIRPWQPPRRAAAGCCWRRRCWSSRLVRWARSRSSWSTRS